MTRRRRVTSCLTAGALLLVLVACNPVARRDEYTIAYDENSESLQRRILAELGRCRKSEGIGSGGDQITVGTNWNTVARRDLVVPLKPGVTLIDVFYNNYHSGWAYTRQFFEIEPIGEDRSLITSYAAYGLLVPSEMLLAHLDDGTKICGPEGGFLHIPGSL